MELKIIGITAALLSAAAWAVGAILYKQLGEKVSAVGMNLVKGLLSLALLLPVLLVTGTEEIGRQEFVVLGVSGLLGIALGDTFFFKALQDLGPHALVLLSMLGQVLTIAFAVLLLAESPTMSTWVGIAMILVGIAIVLFSRLAQGEEKCGGRGVFYGMLSVLCMATAVIIAKKGLESVSAIQATFVRMLWGVCGLVLWGVVKRQIKVWLQPFSNPALIRDIGFAVCVATFGGFFLFHVALKYIDVAEANTLNATEPLFLLPLAAIFLKERITWRAFMGTIVSVAGIVFVFID